jgi:Fis family transcriptional regulator
MNTADTLLTGASTELVGSTPADEGIDNAKKESLRDCVEHAVKNYFQQLDGQDVTDVYDMVLAEVESPLLEVVMKYTRHNQTKAAHVLGLNRGTLRKKLKEYGLL